MELGLVPILFAMGFSTSPPVRVANKFLKQLPFGTEKLTDTTSVCAAITRTVTASSTGVA